jgi:Tfp pilus assembly protein PilF
MNATELPEVPQAPVECNPAFRPSFVADMANWCKQNPTSGPLTKSERVTRAYEEYKDRCRAGEDVDPDEFCRGYPSLQTSLVKVLRQHSYLARRPDLTREKPPPLWPHPGESFLGFGLEAELGRGAFARVFLATDPALGDRPVALKVARAGDGEARTLGPLMHPNIVQVYSIHEDPQSDLTAVCMPYLGSATLDDLLDDLHAATLPARGQTILERVHDQVRPDEQQPPKDSPLAQGTYVEGVCGIGAQLADALHFIHRRKIYHLDLKPSNVLMTPEGRPMLLDFNLSADPEEDTRLGGTLPYMSPEQLRWVGPAIKDLDAPRYTGPDPDGRSDLFSLGVLLYELLTGRHPFGPLPLKLSLKETWQRLRLRHEGGARPIRELNPSLDTSVAEIIDRCLAPAPADRPADAAEVAAALWCQPVRSRRVGRRWWSLAALVAGVALSGTVAAAVWSVQTPAPGEQTQTRDSEETRAWRLGQEAYQQGKYAAAAEHFGKVLQLAPDRLDARLARGHAYRRLGEQDKLYYANAIADYLAAKARQPSGEVSACLGYCLLRQDLSEPARLELETAVKLGFAGADVLNNLAYAEMQLARLKEAADHLDRALVQKPPLQAALHNRAMLRLKLLAQAGARARQEQFHPEVKQAKDDIHEALASGKAGMELNRDAGRLFAYLLAYDPEDERLAIKYLEHAVDQGYDPAALAKDAMLGKLRDVASFQALTGRRVDVKPMPPTQRIAEPLRG